jgi:heptosyltransferase-2
VTTAARARRIVVLAPNWLGDAVMALPALADIRRAHPDAHLAVAARPGLAPLFTMVPGIDHTLALDRSGRLRGSQGDVARLRGGRFDRAVLFPNAFRAAWAVRAAGIAERWGYASDLRRWLLTRAVPRPEDPRLHQAAYYQRLTTALGLPAGPLQPMLTVSRDAIQNARGVLEAHGWRGEPLVGLAPGAAYGTAKQWPPDRVGRLVAEVARHHAARFVIVGSPGDAGAAAEVRTAATGAGAAASTILDLCGETDLVALAAIFTLCRMVVANDSGAMHVAAAVGTPVTAVFGPTREWATAPLQAVGGGSVTIVKTDVWCRPCMLRNCPIDHQCMTGVSVEMVARPVHAALTSQAVVGEHHR